ncbi:MAG TPA: GNAT family N-acetyltransferase [Steroidobacteraceae bacterium]|nr:GNAT family N-acetyltransferase [Steroidobacteraceae bacterium]
MGKSIGSRATSSGSRRGCKLMHEGWRIRRAIVADADELARLSGVLGYGGEADSMGERLAQLLATADHLIAVAVAADDPESARGGWVHVARHVALETAPFAEILGLVVDRPVRRAGIGRALIAEAEHWARAHRLQRLTVRSNVVRRESHQFYPALGFEHTKSQHVYSKPLAADAGAVA